MAASYRAFLTELSEEYLSEASSFYERRKNAAREGFSTWLDMAPLEKRLEANLDGLVVGGDLALEVCRRQAENGDCGELYAAICIFCRQQRLDLILKTLDSLDTEDIPKIDALADALKHEAPQKWCEELTRMFRFDLPPKKLKVLSRVLGWRRWEPPEGIDPELSRAERFSLADVLWAAGRLKSVKRTHLPFVFVEDANPAISFEASLAVLRHGDRQILGFLQRKPVIAGTAFLVMGLAGGKSTADHLLRRALTGKTSLELLIALGLLGSPDAVPYLISQLTDPDVAPTAAIALHTITSADLLENVFVPETVDEDELFEHEKGKDKAGPILIRADGKPFGSNERRLSLDPRKWTKWWSTKSGDYNPAYCYRNGKFMNPTRLLECLESAQYPNQIRSLVIEELAIRYGCDVSIESDMTVVSQKNAIGKFRTWLEINRSRFQDGAWYFYGSLVP
jgi:uncharacterized protein (TIGR02270 family)